ncbi:MAG: CBS domain-containing protein [Planctomycetes bacterium]|nr:CBS domain-containing protein [Planctomycetota bacterium]
MDNEQNNTVHLTTSPRSKRFVPTCKICGNKHWPRDPSCTGKKGAKAKAKAKGAAQAKARAKRLGLGPGNITRPAEQPLQVNLANPVSAPTSPAPAAANVSARPTQPASEPVFPPRQNTDIQPRRRQHQGGKKVFRIKAKSHEEITSFTDEINRIKRQADEVVLSISEDAAHRVESERTARRNAEERALNEAAARLKAEQKLQAQIEKLKALQQEARKATPTKQQQIQNIQAQFTDAVTNNTDKAGAIKPSETSVNSTSFRVASGYTASNPAALLAIRARQIMETNIVCVDAEDTISRVLDQMLVKDSYYAIVTDDSRIAGIVSRTDLTGPVSESLRPHIAKWQRRGSDATFNIAVKWVMSRQVKTIDSDATCTAIMKKMRQLNMCPLLVADEGKVLGIVTPFNVFKIRALLKLESDNTTTTNRQLIQALPARISSYLSDLNAAKKTIQEPETQAQG